MPSPDAISPAPNGYLRRVLWQGSMPFRYRSGVRSLLGMPASGEDAIIGAAGMPPIEFRYAVSPSLAAMTAPDSLAADRWVEAALNDLDSEEWTGLEHSPARSRQPPAIGASSPSHQVGTNGGRYNPENGEDRAQRNPSTLRAGAVGAAPSPRSEQGSPAIAARAALLQVPPVDAVPLPTLISQAEEPPCENLSTTRVGAVGAAPPPRSEQEPPALAPKAAPPQVTSVDLAPGNQAEERRFEALSTEPVGTSAAIQPSATWQRADQMPKPGQLQRLSPGTGPTHPHATGAATPLQTKALTPGELMAEAGWADQPTTITIPGRVPARRPASNAGAATDRDNSPPGGTNVAPSLAASTSNPSAQVRADAHRPTSNAVGVAPSPRPDPAPAAVALRAARLQVTPDDPPAVGVTTGAYPSASSAAEQIARLRHVVSELAAQVAAQRDFQQRPTPLFPLPVRPVANVEHPVPRTGTSRAFWERSYINRLYRWSRR